MTLSPYIKSDISPEQYLDFLAETAEISKTFVVGAVIGPAWSLWNRDRIVRHLTDLWPHLDYQPALEIVTEWWTRKAANWIANELHQETCRLLGVEP